MGGGSQKQALGKINGQDADVSFVMSAIFQLPKSKDDSRTEKPGGSPGFFDWQQHLLSHQYVALPYIKKNSKYYASHLHFPKKTRDVL